MKHRSSALTLAFALLAAFTLTVPARADLIAWEPTGNSFYDAHHDGCGFVGRSYLTNGQQGYVTLREAPEVEEAVYNVPNSEAVYVESSVPLSGVEWGFCEYAAEGDSSKKKFGWAPMTELALIYDSFAFLEDHRAECQGYDGSEDDLGKVCLYSIPGGVLERTLEEDRDESFSQTFARVYTDENDRRWSYIGTYTGEEVDAWVCLDDPLNEGLGVDVYPTAAAVRGTGDEVLVPPAENVPQTAAFPVWLLPAGLIVLAAAVTALLIRRGQRRTA